MDEIRRALLGDRAAQERLTRSGVLLPCQCGGQADCNGNALMKDGEFKWAVECLSCGIILGPFETEEEATKTWNARASILEPEELERLEESK